MFKRTFQLLLMVGLMAGTLWAAEDPFVGKWKLNASKSTLFDEMKVKAAGENKYAFDFGAGQSETIVTDGTDQPGIFGTTLAVSVEGTHSWKVVRKKDGHLMVSATWTLSEDGTTLTDHFKGYRADGSTMSMDYVYARTGGGTGFAGTWDSTSEKLNSDIEVQIQPFETDGLAFTNSSQHETQNMKFDGKDYPDAGPNVAAGSVASGRRVSERTLEITDKIKDKVTNTRRVEISADNKTLTMTVQPVSQSKPNVLVFDRE